MAATCADILAAQGELWSRAVDSPFLDACNDGSIQPAQFDCWLAQDGLFAREFTRLHGAMLAKAPYPHVDLLLGGAAALKDELSWFDSLAAKRGVSLDVPPLPACARYTLFMEKAAQQPYAVLATVHWAIERCYNEAWHDHMRGMPAPYHHYAERWGSMAFGQYVGGLQRQADEALAAASLAERQEAAALVGAVCELEAAFWSMAYEGSSSTEQ